MKHLSYIAKTLCHNRWDTLIKIFSIGLGLAVSSFLFVRIAHDQSMDTCYKDYQDIYQLWMQYEIDGEKYDKQEMCVGKLAEGIVEDMPDMVQAGTHTRWVGRMFIDGNEVEGIARTAASSFFEVFGAKLLEGADLSRFDSPDAIYVSDKFAQRYFPDGEVLGKTININKDQDFTIVGIFESWGDESTIKTDAVISSKPAELYLGWNGGDSWPSYIRVKPGTDIDALNTRIHQLIKEKATQSETVKLDAWAEPMRDTYRNYDQVKHINFVLSILAAAILLVSAFNYVLLSVASLGRRAKVIGILKTNGVNRSGIFSMFIWETLLILFCGVILMGLIFLATKEWATETIYPELTVYMSMNRLWVLLAVIALVFAITALIPAKIFSDVPVSAAFRKFTQRHNSWKYCLLFIEFAGIALIVGILGVVNRQYEVLINGDLGYNAERTLLSNTRGMQIERENLFDFIKQLPYVEDVSSSESFPGMGYSGDLVRDEKGNTLFSSRFDSFSEDYPEFMQFTLVQGRFPKANQAEVIINQEFARKCNWREEDAVGKTIDTYLGTMKICGVVKDFQTMNYYEPIQPYYGSAVNEHLKIMNIRLKEPFEKNLQRLYDDSANAFSGESFYYKPVKKYIEDTYANVRTFEKVTAITGVIVLLMALVGLVGYMRDELRRRSSEIAIRKVNGSSVKDVLSLMCVDVLKVAVPSVAFGMALAWFIGREWLDQFSITLENIGGIFILLGLALLALIIGVTALFSLRIATSNPVDSLKSE